jgi:4-amino-4-deoxy-L-arabinose transferase-like glycosyltransferase
LIPLSINTDIFNDEQKASSKMNFLIRKAFKRGSVPQATLLFAASILVLMVLHAVSLRFYPPVFVDEAIMISRAWAWLQTGVNFGPLEAGVFDKRFEGFWTFHPLIPTWFHALFVQMFGLDLSILRFASLLCGAGLLAAVFSVSYQLSASSRCASIAVLLVIVSFAFILSAHHIRYDIIVAALAFSAIAIHLAASKRKSVLLSILSGLLLGMAFEVHVNAAIYGPVIVALFFADEGWRFYRQRVFWGFVGGVGIMLAWYLWAHVVRYPEAYFGIGRAMAGTHYPPLLIGNPLALIMAIAEMGRYLLILTQFRIAVTLVAGFMLWQRRLARKELLMFVVGFLSFGLMVKNKMDYYLILIAPFADIVLAEWIEQFLFQKKTLPYLWKLGRALVTSLLIASLLFSLAVFLITFLFPPLNEIKRVAQHIERVIPTGGSVMGSQLYWFDLHEYRYISWQQIIAYQKTYAASTFDDAMMALRPDVLLIDNHLREFILADEVVAPKSGLARYFWERRLRKDDLDAFLKLRGTLRDRVKTAGSGAVDIYTINWRNLQSNVRSN